MNRDPSPPKIAAKPADNTAKPDASLQTPAPVVITVKNPKRSKKTRMEYREINFKDGSSFKGMLKSGTLISQKKKYVTGTGEFTYA